jgi:hypothetical protein
MSWLWNNDPNLDDVDDATAQALANLLVYRCLIPGTHQTQRRDAPRKLYCLATMSQKKVMLTTKLYALTSLAKTMPKTTRRNQTHKARRPLTTR